MKRSGFAAWVGVASIGVTAPVFADDTPRGVMHAHPSPSASVNGGPRHFRPDNGGPRNWQSDLADSFRLHRPTQEQMRAAIAAAHATAQARRQAHMAEARQRYGALASSNREVFVELRVHARRMAFLNRAKLVATTELEDPKRSTVLARIEKLTAAEQARHLGRMDALKANAAPAPSAGAPTEGNPAEGVAVASATPLPSGKPGKPAGPPLKPPGLHKPAGPKGSAP